MSEPKRLRLDPTIDISDFVPTPNPGSDTRRRSSRADSRRRFECTHPGCGRDYSRAEHLYRHQLNHNPKEIFKCDYEGCSRTFVRQDLCIRHRDRHDNRDKSTSQQRDPNQESLSPGSSVSNGGLNDSTSPNSNVFATPRPPSEAARSPVLGRTSLGFGLAAELRAMRQHTHSDSNGTNDPARSQSNADSRQSFFRRNSHTGPQSQNPADNYASQTASLGSFSFQRSHSFGDGPFDNVDPAILGNSGTQSNVSMPPTGNRQMQDQSTAAYSMPGRGEQPFNDSPVSIRDEFTAWLFDDAAGLHAAPFSMASQPGMGFANPSDIFGNTTYSNYFADTTLDAAYPGMVPNGSVETPTSSIELPVNSGLLSPAKRQSLIVLMESRFHDGDNLSLRQLRDEIFQGNLDAEEHILSLRSMQHYIGSYWYHFHAQLPILHQPTFSADDINEYLLLAVMAIGAAQFEKVHGRQARDTAARLATFIAWHLRWQVFMHNDFHPPAKLWVLQTLLLLEVFEKTSATRVLHERAHIHHATTINLMRRGTALIEPQQDSARVPSTPEEWWSRWITAEATRRAAFAAFYLDAVHATMFGHAAMMVVHEIRLPLPCDDALWSATSAAEVGRVEASLHANGIKSTTFLDGLKKTLTGRKVRTNTFGRMILMAGLLSVSWHMHQRDLQVSSLGVSSTMGVPDGWRIPLTKAFDFWKKDFDENIEHMRRAALPWQKNDSWSADEAMTDTADVLYHMSHMAMHVESWDCQIFAGIKRLFGRKVSRPDYERVKAKIFDWSKGQGATVGVYHALQLLKSVILPNRDPKRLYNARDDYLLVRPWTIYYAALVVWSYGFALDGVLRPFPSLLQPASSPGAGSVLSHGSGRSMLNMAHDGSEFQVEAVVKDAQAFLQTIGAVKSPQQLESIKDGRNNVVGILAILETAFRDCRWELLHEAAERLRNAIMLLRGASRS
ncbi:hypothetical protein LTR47_010914 [Exophiala xenobiotica]|nr:hypothetical protein LTR92_005443 [Exophiala xenobiotica]KAK5220761.1 hypothetical protein LTR72_007383 [Exophiala xenobiotica]KAK5221528.1 hypothetical protein LTR47_010914 [Exophiala xenobiotica]KAK5246058.1 hypothetical protein LTS06_008618 [Exophiala xenobiotica]KAK5285380.1 hypothetical protein LTR14_011015 [Exophiala xenobiotica]